MIEIGSSVERKQHRILNMNENACELLSSSTGKSLTLLGKSIEFHKKLTLPNKSSISLTKSDTNVIPMRHSHRIKQLYLPVCLHEVKHEIANHYRDTKCKKATKTRTKGKRSLAAALHRKSNRFSKFAATATTASAIMHRRRMGHRRFILSQREVLQIPSFTFPRAISQEPTINVPKGRQTLCNLHGPNDIPSVQVIENSTSSLINCMFQKGHKKSFTKHFTSFIPSFETKNRINQANTNSKLYESVGCRPSVEPLQQQHKAQTCRRKSQKQTCTANQSHVEIRTSNAITRTPAPNCNYRQLRKTYSRNTNDGNHDCINNTINTNSQSEWYIELASNCYRNGFQLHVNHLDECSKHPSVLQRKPAQAAFLRLPSSALLFQSPSLPSLPLPPPPSPSPRTIDSSDSAVSLIPDLVLCSSPKSITVALHCDKTYSSDSFSYKIQSHCRPHQLNTGENNRIYCKKHLGQTCNPIDVHTRLPITDTIPIARQPTLTEQFNVLNAKNNMNSVAVDANNLQQNLQLSCQAIQYNYRNNNLTFNQEYQASGQQEPQTIANNNNYQQHQHWVDKNHPNSISTDQRRGIEVLPTATENPTRGDIVNDLIDAFNSSFDVSEAKQIQLPQIILSDFSSDQPTPPTTPLFFTIQTSSRTLSEHSPQLKEFQIYQNAL